MNSFSVFVLIVVAFLATVSALPSLSPVQVQGQTLLMKVEDSPSESTLDELVFEDESAFLATVTALPSPSADQVQDHTILKETGDLGSDATLDELILEEDTGEVGDRFRRATCDLLSVSTMWGSLNHAACAAHCLAMRKGYRGGRCKDGVCHCRR